MDLLNKAQPKQVIAYADWLAAGAPAVAAVKVEADVNVPELLPLASGCTEIQIEFPVFADGRGFSIARLLRREGYTGIIRAVGDVAVDRVAFMQRVGFDAIDLKEGQQADLIPQLIERVQIHYQTSSDGAGPIYTATQNS
ncbi:MAG: DUF934 domain-containing protein [Gammaproteobacteria bacterium]|jgi:uncharacterized protein (DUF934 family)|nr:DUF934 domain-containing protein [Gammaproteobacteria bacterium]